MIARTFYRRGIIEEWGRGTLKMAEETTAAGLPPLEIEDKGGCVTVRFRHSRPPPPPAEREVPARTATGNPPVPLGLFERRR